MTKNHTRSIRIRTRLACWIVLGLVSGLLEPIPFAAAAEQETVSASISIDANTVAGRISPLLYGQFIEFMFEGVKFGLDAELLHDRSFEDPANAIGLPRYWERYPDDRNDDYGLNFTWDGSVRYPTRRLLEHSLRVDVGDGVIQRHGIFQSRLAIRSGTEYQGYFWLRTTDYHGRILVALEADASSTVYAEAQVTPVSGDWRKYEFRLRPSVTDPLARLAIIFEGQGRLWLDQCSLLPRDAVGGVRLDVFDKVRALHPAFVHWPGGNVAQDYHWQWGVGPRDMRTTWKNLSWKNEPEPSDFGTHEFISFSRNLGAEPALTINVEGQGATAVEAAAWVEYCNGPRESKYGALRATHGHPEPYRVRLWEIGNEIWGSWVRGHSDAETYARNLNRYATAMRKVDPTIKLIAVGDNDMKWNRTVLREAGPNIDYLAIHHYYGRREIAGDVRNLMARPLFYGRFYQEVANLIRELSPQHDIRLAINEWGLDLRLPQQYSMLSALYAARLLNIFERSRGLVAMSAVSDLINGWPGGIIQSGRQGLFVSPIYLVNVLYNECLGDEQLATEVLGPTFDTSHEGKGVPFLDVAVSRSPDRQTIFVKAVNTDLTRALVTTITVKGATILPQAELMMVNGKGLDSANSFATPDAVAVTRMPIKGSSDFQLTLPPHSVSIVKLQVAK